MPVPEAAEQQLHPIITDMAAVKSARELHNIAEDYVKLSLELGEQEAGYVDAYYGPQLWAEAAKAKPRSLSTYGQSSWSPKPPSITLRWGSSFPTSGKNS